MIFLDKEIIIWYTVVHTDTKYFSLFFVTPITPRFSGAAASPWRETDPRGGKVLHGGTGRFGAAAWPAPAGGLK